MVTGKGHEWISLQRRQYTSEKMLSIVSHEGKPRRDTTSHPLEWLSEKQTNKKVSVGKNLEKLESLSIIGKNTG